MDALAATRSDAPLDAQRPKVLHLGPDLHGPGGMPAVVRTLLASSLRDDHDLAFLATHRTSATRTRLRHFALAWLRLVGWCLGRGPRIVHVHTATRGSWYRKAVCVWTARSLGRPVVLHFHSGPGDMRAFVERLGPWRLGMVGAAFRRADRVVAVSSASAAEVERTFGFARVVEVIPNAAPSLPPGLRRRTGEPPVLLYLGGFANPAKGGDALLRALPGILERAPSASVVLAGPGEPPASARALLTRPAVRWAGYLDQAGKAEVFGRDALLVMPSRSEGMPVALLEAMAYGAAIVATRVGGIPEVVADGVTACLVEPDDHEALGRAITDLLADPARRRTLGEAARRRAERLNAAEVLGPLGALYGSLTDRPRPALVGEVQAP